MRELKIPDQRHPEKAHRPDQAQPKKPAWIRVKAPTSQGYKDTREILKSNKLVTVCEEAGCPNVGECWSQGHATMMIMGEICTRGCSFCNVATGRPDALDVFEPGRVAHAVQTLGLKHVVITSVDRDDLKDGGAEHFANVIHAIRKASPGTTIEILTPDFLKNAFAPTLAAFQARHGIQVVAVSMDGGPMPGFPEARPDNGIATTLKVTQVPAIFLAQPFTGRITPIGFGVLSESQLLERIVAVSSPQADAMPPSSAPQIVLK